MSLGGYAYIDLTGMSGAQIRAILGDSSTMWGRMFGWMVDGIASGLNLQQVLAFNAAIRAEIRGDRQLCWANGNFVGVTGRCVEDPAEGVAKALAQLNGDTPFDPSGVRKTRLEGYLAYHFYREWDEATASGDGSQIKAILDKYGQYSAVMSSNPFIGGNSFNLTNPQQVLDRLILGDGDWGVTVQMCSATVTTNCVDPTAINDIWEDLGRHAQVIFKGLEIPGIPDWLPLPGIMRLPTIGEIWDTVTGPFRDEARRQLNECMAGPDGVSGTADDKSASVCFDERDIASIITNGVINGAGDIVDATVEKVNEIVDKALETLDCVTDPAACAGKVKEVIEGVFGGADPTQPGLPDWMRVIIIGGQYGDEILRELEKIFNEDINGDGTIGIGPDDPDPTFDCSSLGKQGGMVFDASECGDCINGNEKDYGNGCEPQCEFDPELPASSEECVNPNTFDCSSVGKSGGMVQSEADCGECLDTAQKDFGNGCEPFCEWDETIPATDSQCEEPLTETEIQCNEQGKVYDSLNDECKEECKNPDYVIGADGNCGPEPVEECTDPNRDKNPDGSCADTCSDGSPAPASGLCPEPVEQCTDPNRNTNDDGSCADTCADGSTAPASGLCPEPVEQCTDPNREKNADGSCGDTCTDGSPAPASGLCPQPEGCEEVDCNGPRPNAASSFDAQRLYRLWNECCSGTNCPEDGSLITDHPGNDCTIPIGTVCDNGGTIESGCTECANNGTIESECNQCPGNNTVPSWHVDGDCLKPVTFAGEPCGPNGEVYQDDGSCGPPDSGICEDPNATNTGEFGDCQCPAGYTVSEDGTSCIADGVDCTEITDANYQECGKEKCADGTFADVGQCASGPDCTEITDANYQECGKEKCEDGTFADIGQCATGPQECAKPDGTPTGATLESNCEQCPDGYTFDFNGICQADSGTINCDDYNRTTNDDGTCGPCKEGYQADTSLPDEPCVPIFDGCPDGYVLDQDLGDCVPVTCPEGQSYCVDTGQCEDDGTCVSDPPPPPGSNPFAGASGGNGMMTGNITGYMGDPQLLSRSEFPITDYLAGLFENIRGNQA